MNRLFLAGLLLRTCLAITSRHDARVVHETISSGGASENSFFRKLGIQRTYGLRPAEFLAVMESSWEPEARTGTLALLSANETYEGSCQDAQPGSVCYHASAWLRAEGLAKYPDWYPSLGEDSTTQEVQAVLHSLGKADCPRPCQTRIAKRLVQSPDDRVLEVDGSGRQVLSGAYKLSEPTGCGDVVEGDWCYLSIEWLKNMGLDKHPDWYPGLTRESSIQDFQTMLHNNGKVGCPLPCASKVEEPVTTTAPRDIARAVVSRSAVRVNAELEDCEIPQVGSRCYNAIKDVVQVGLEVHPELYPELSESSSREEIQEHLYLRRQYDCGRPCPKEQIAKHKRTRRVKMNVADMTESELTMYLNHEWDGYVNADEYIDAVDVDGVSAKENAFEEYTDAVAADDAAAANVSSAAGGVPPHMEQLNATATALQPEGGVDAEALPVVTNEMVQEPSETQRLSAEDSAHECRDASVGELCYQAVTWAQTVGILQRPSWYTGLSKSSTFKEFQAYLHKERGSLCKMPCPDAAGASTAAGGAAQPEENAQANSIGQDEELEELVPELVEQRANSTGQEPALEAEERQVLQPDNATEVANSPAREPVQQPQASVVGEPLPQTEATTEEAIAEAPQQESAAEAANSTVQEEPVLQPQAETVQVNSTEEPASQPEAAIVEEEDDFEPLPWVTGDAEEGPLAVREPLPEVTGDVPVADSAIEEPAPQPENATEAANSTVQEEPVLQTQAETVQINSTEEPAPQPEAATAEAEPLPWVNADAEEGPLSVGEPLPEVKGDVPVTASTIEERWRQFSSGTPTGTQ
jgi:hypothetical protein